MEKQQVMGDTVSSDGRSAALRAEPAAQSQAKPAPTIADILDRAADLITPEGAWIGGPEDWDYARTEGGYPVGTQDEDACAFCLFAATERAAGAEDTPEAANARKLLRSILPRGELVEWNHGVRRTQAEVVAKLREAAALARGDQA